MYVLNNWDDIELRALKKKIAHIELSFYRKKKKKI